MRVTNVQSVPQWSFMTHLNSSQHGMRGKKKVVSRQKQTSSAGFHESWWVTCQATLSQLPWQQSSRSSKTRVKAAARFHDSVLSPVRNSELNIKCSTFETRDSGRWPWRGDQRKVLYVGFSSPLHPPPALVSQGHSEWNTCWLPVK